MAKKEQQNKTNLKKINNESLGSISGGYNIEKKLVNRKIMRYTDPGTHTSAHKYVDVYKYIVTGTNGSKTFNNINDATKWAEKYAD